MFFRRRTRCVEQEEKYSAEKDIRIHAIPWSFSEQGFTLYFDNGITVKVTAGTFVFMDVQILTPTHDITNRFKKLYGLLGITPELLLKILNTAANLPCVYTVNELPDSCFDFKE